MSAYTPQMVADLNMDDLSDARAFFEKEYREETTLFNGSKIAAGQYRRYADAVAQAAIFIGTAHAAALSQLSALSAREKVLLEGIRNAHKLLGALRPIDLPIGNIRDSVGAAYCHLGAALSPGEAK